MIGIVHKASLLYNVFSSKPCLQFVVHLSAQFLSSCGYGVVDCACFDFTLVVVSFVISSQFGLTCSACALCGLPQRAVEVCQWEGQWEGQWEWSACTAVNHS